MTSYDSSDQSGDRESGETTEKKCDDDSASVADGLPSPRQLMAKLLAEQKLRMAEQTLRMAEQKLRKEAEEAARKFQDENESLRHALNNPWAHLRVLNSSEQSPSGPTKAEKRALRAKCAHKCQVSDETSSLIISHIWTKEFAAELKSEYGGRFRINGQENLLHLIKPLEFSFDAGQLCFLPRASVLSMDGVLELTILCQSICNDFVPGTLKTFKDLEGVLLDMSEHMPSFTLIARHAKEAIMFAHTQEWITSDEKESLLARAKFFSPESSKAREIQKWLKSHLDSGESGTMPLLPALTTLHIVRKLPFFGPRQPRCSIVLSVTTSMPQVRTTLCEGCTSVRKASRVRGSLPQWWTRRGRRARNRNRE
jgi:hypothetical protein